ncbi:hypothetical protein JCM11251_006548 [Rhodosporidiobolus azoricus]
MLTRTVQRTALRCHSRPSVAVKPLPAIVSPLLARSSSRPFSTSPPHLYPRSERGTGKESFSEGVAQNEELKASGGGKIQTVPFQISPSRGLHISNTAAHSAFGISYVLRLVLARFFQRFFGISPDAFGGFFHTGVKRVAFKPLLVPVWKVDLAVKGKALLDQCELSLSISALNASLPGFRLDPLDRLSASPPLDPSEAPLEPFSPSKHVTNAFTSLPPPSTQDFSSGDNPEVALIPFTRTPLGLLDKLASFPRTLSSAEGGLSFDPKQFEPVLFAAYPVYLPVYLGEFELEDMFPGEDEPRRVTTAAFATTDGTAFAVYPQFLSPPTWLPSSSAVDLSISGRPTNPNDLPSPESLQNLKPKLEEALEEVKERIVEGASGSGGIEGGMDPAQVTEVVNLSGGEAFEAYVAKEGRALGYEDHADENREYVEAVWEADTAEAFLHQIENLPDNARPVLISSTSLPKLSSREDLLSSLRSKLNAARAKVDALRPQWLEEVVKVEKERKEEERRARAKSARARGRA